MPRRRPGAILPLELDILDAGAVLQSSEGSFYGFALARSLSGGDGELTAHGTLYKALSRMTTAGLITSEWEDPAVAEEEGRPRRRLYRLTGEGELARDREHARLAAEARRAGSAGDAVWTWTTPTTGNAAHG